MFPTYILALALLAQPGSAPRLLEPHESREACYAQADKLNRTDERLRSNDARVLGVEYVCLKVERVGT